MGSVRRLARRAAGATRGMTPLRERSAAVVVLIFGAWLLWRAAAEQSLTLDEPYHLLPGLQMHQHGANTLHLDHPPLVKWVAAWPLANEPDLASPPLGFAEARPAWGALFGAPEATRRYQLASRGAVVAFFVLPFLALLYLWGRRYGERVGFLWTSLVVLAPITLPYLPLVMTDAAVALGFLATVAAGTLYAEQPGAGRAALLGLAFGLAVAAKLSGLLAAPAVLAAFVFAGAAQDWPWRRLVVHGSLAGGAALMLVYAPYALVNRNADPALVARSIEDCIAGAGSAEVAARMAGAAPALRRLAAFSPELGQLAAGLLLVSARDRTGVLASVAFGHLTSEERWWYFPALLAVQTPLVLLLAGFAAGRAGRGRWQELLRQPRWALPGTATAFYLAIAIFSHYNIGLRHLLPVLPFLLLPIAVWAGRRIERTALLLILLAAESAALAPLWISSTNTWWLGRHDPAKLAFSAFEYKHSLIALAAEAKGLEPPVRVFYPLMEQRELRAYLPRADVVHYGEPLEPGWYAVNLQAEILLPAIYRTGPDKFALYRAYRQAGRPWLHRLEEIQSRGEDQGFIAGTFRLYRVGASPAD